MSVDPLDAAVGQVHAAQSTPQPMAEAVYERRNYPDCPEGTFVAICCNVELKVNPMDSDFDPGMTKINHRWQVMSDVRTGQPVFYVDPKDETKKERQYQVFGKALSISFGDRANLPKIMKELTGIAPLKTVTNETRILEGSNQPKQVKIVRFDQSVLENMVCELRIKREALVSDPSRTRLVIDDYSCTPAMRYSNWSMLPAHPDKVAFEGFEAAKAAYDAQYATPSPSRVSPLVGQYQGSNPQDGAPIAPVVPR